MPGARAAGRPAREVPRPPPVRTYPVAVTSATIVAGLLGLVAVCFLLLSLRRVPSGTTGVMERLGRYHRTLSPGLHLALPGDRIRAVDRSEQRSYFPDVAVAAVDAPMLADGFVSYAVGDARLVTYEVADHRSAVQHLAITSLRALASSRTAEDLLASSGQVAEQLRGVLQETGPTWGLEIRDVEITLLRDQPRSSPRCSRLAPMRGRGSPRTHAGRRAGAAGPTAGRARPRPGGSRWCSSSWLISPRARRSRRARSEAIRSAMCCRMSTSEAMRSLSSVESWLGNLTAQIGANRDGKSDTSGTCRMSLPTSVRAATIEVIRRVVGATQAGRDNGGKTRTGWL